MKQRLQKLTLTESLTFRETSNKITILVIPSGEKIISLVRAILANVQKIQLRKSEMIILPLVTKF